VSDADVKIGLGMLSVGCENNSESVYSLTFRYLSQNRQLHRRPKYRDQLLLLLLLMMMMMMLL